VLKKYEFFKKGIFLNSFSDKKPFEIKVISSHSGENYIKCIQLMYTYYIEEIIYFLGVDEALSILLVAFKVMFHDCIESSM
jgi:hypothetical protein